MSSVSRLGYNLKCRVEVLHVQEGLLVGSECSISCIKWCLVRDVAEDLKV